MEPDNKSLEPAGTAGVEPGLPPGQIPDKQPAEEVTDPDQGEPPAAAGGQHSESPTGPARVRPQGGRPCTPLQPGAGAAGTLDAPTPDVAVKQPAASDDQRAAELERLLLADLGEGATAAKFDAIAVQALAFMGAEDSGGRKAGDPDFMHPVKHPKWGVQAAELVLGKAEALDSAIAAGLLERLVVVDDSTYYASQESRFKCWAKGAASSRKDAGDAGGGAAASAGDTAAYAHPAARVVLMMALLTRVTSCAAPEKEAMLEQLLGARLAGAGLSGVPLQKAKLFRAQLQKADLTEAQLQKADLREAQLQEVRLRKAQLQEAKLEKAQLQDAKLYKAQLQEADLRRAHFQKANFREVRTAAPCIRSSRRYNLHH
jgi:hypothetical protein